MNRPNFSRRSVLLQLASIPITLTLARSLKADPPAVQKRLVVFMANNGTKRCTFWPTRPSPTAATYPLTNTPILNALFTNDGVTDNGIKAKTNLIRGMQVTNNVTMSGNQHDIGFARMFTGAPLMPTADGTPWGGAISVDQIMANDWNVRSLTTAVYASAIEPYPKPGFNHRQSFSYLAPQQLNLPVIDPLTAFQNTFPEAADPGGRQRLLDRRSVLDSVSGDLQEIAGRLGPDDRQKLDFHLTAVRDTENMLSTLLSNHAGCTTSPSAPRDFKSIAPGLANNEINIETYLPDMIDAMVAIMAAALKCGVTRVASLQLGYGGGKWNFGWRGLNMNHHQFVAHLDTFDDPGATPDQLLTTQRATTISQYYADVVRKLAVDLNASPDGSGTMLDSTLIVWSNEFGRGDHSLTDIPAVLVGLVGNGIASGGNVYDVASARGGMQQPHNILGYHILNALGHKTAGWGDIADMSPYAIPGF
jgi:hypothetical protein